MCKQEPILTKCMILDAQEAHELIEAIKISMDSFAAKKDGGIEMVNKPRYKYSSLRHGGAFLTQLFCRHEFKGYTKYGGVKLLCGIQQCRKCGRYRQVVT